MTEQAVLLMVSIDAGAEKLARQLVTDRLAACVHCLPTGTSIYAWQGEIETAAETTLLIKSVSGRVDQLMEKIQELHPYDVPEILVFSARDGLPAYLQWLVKETSGDSPC